MDNVEFLSVGEADMVWDTAELVVKATEYTTLKDECEYLTNEVVELKLLIKKMRKADNALLTQYLHLKAQGEKP